MNVAIILSGGKGLRYGAKVPKQYLDLNGKPVIDYVISAAKNSKKTNEIIMVINKDNLCYSKEIDKKKMAIVPNGKERHYSLKNALDYINKFFPKCENVIILNAVSPMVTSDLIDDYFNRLNEYEIIITCEKCPGELINDKFDRIDRNKYYFAQSPEAYKFKLLYKYFNPESKYTEVAYHLPKKSKVYLNLDFKNNIKITYETDLILASILLKDR